MGIFNRNSSLTPYREQSPWSLWQKEMSDLFDRFNRDFGTFDTGEMNQFYPKIEIKVRKTDIGVVIQIQDNGTGYRLENNKKHSSKGISIVQRRLDLTQKNLQKQLEIFSTDRGTTIVLTIDGTNLQ